MGMLGQTNKRVWHFGDFDADARSGELRKHGTRMKLGGQPFQVLIILLQRAGEVVTREELQQALWPGDTFVDFDHSLNTAINKLRAVLGDSGSNPRYIETLSRRGYRFIATVTGAEATPSPHAVFAVTNGDGSGAAVVTDAIATDSRIATTADEELPRPHRGTVQFLFCLAQTMYLILYFIALVHFGGVERETSVFAGGYGLALAIAVLVIAAAGIPVRFFLLFATLFGYRYFVGKFEKLFPALLLIDLLWALTPFLLTERIGIGGAFAATAALVYLPFGERTLVRMSAE